MIEYAVRQCDAAEFPMELIDHRVFETGHEDLKEHDFEGTCWRKPDVPRIQLPISTGTLIVHHSADGRVPVREPGA